MKLPKVIPKTLVFSQFYKNKQAEYYLVITR